MLGGEGDRGGEKAEVYVVTEVEMGDICDCDGGDVNDGVHGAGLQGFWKHNIQ